MIHMLCILQLHIGFFSPDRKRAYLHGTVPVKVLSLFYQEGAPPLAVVGTANYLLLLANRSHRYVFVQNVNTFIDKNMLS